MKILAKTILICFILSPMFAGFAGANAFSSDRFKFKSGAKNVARQSSGASTHRPASIAKPNLGKWFKGRNNNHIGPSNTGVKKMVPNSGKAIPIKKSSWFQSKNLKKSPAIK